MERTEGQLARLATLPVLPAILMVPASPAKVQTQKCGLMNIALVSPKGEQTRLSITLNVGYVIRVVIAVKRQETPIVAEPAYQVELKLRWRSERVIAKEVIFRKRVQRLVVFKMVTAWELVEHVVHLYPLPLAPVAGTMDQFLRIRQADIVFARTITLQKLIQYHLACFVTKAA